MRAENAPPRWNAPAATAASVKRTALGSTVTPSGAESVRTRRALRYAIYCALLLIGTFFLAPALRDLRPAAGAAAAIFIATLLMHVKVNPDRPLSVGTLYVLLLGLFHTGLFLPYALTGTFAVIKDSQNDWLKSSALPDAAVIYCVSQLLFSLAYLSLTLRVSQPKEERAQRIEPPTARNRAGILGSSFFLLGLALWIRTASTSGAAILGGSYTEFLAATAKSNLPTAYLLMGIGLPVAAASDGAPRRIAFGAFCAWAGPAFLLGLRGEVLIPLAAYIAVRARRRRIRYRWWWPLTLVGALGAGSLVRAVRAVGLSGSNLALSNLSPLGGISELGYSVRPLAVVLEWTASGEPPVGVGTYFHPLLRIMAGRVMGLPVPSATDDPTTFNAVIESRLGPIGGSTIAEAYRAGGIPMVAVVMIILAALIARLDRFSSTALRDAAVGGSSFILYLWVRNTFTPVPLQLTVLLVVLGAIRLAPAEARRGRSGHAHRKAD